MGLFFGKLGFVHRQLWTGNPLYRLSVLAGPAPLLGALVAGALWAAGVGGGAAGRPALPRWATPDPNDKWNSADGPIRSVKPRAPLPLVDGKGNLAGYKPGPRLVTNPIQVQGSFDVNVENKVLTAVPYDGARLDMDRIIASGPKQGLYVGVADGILVIRTAGVYTLTLRHERAPAQPASCVERLGFGGHRVISNLDLSLYNQVDTTFQGAQFELEAGLYPIGWAYGCWHEQAETAPGSLSLMIGHPGEAHPLPAQPDEIVHREGETPAN
jgi:hypothetical protein